MRPMPCLFHRIWHRPASANGLSAIPTRGQQDSTSKSSRRGTWPRWREDRISRGKSCWLDGLAFRRYKFRYASATVGVCFVHDLIVNARRGSFHGPKDNHLESTAAKLGGDEMRFFSKVIKAHRRPRG